MTGELAWAGVTQEHIRQDGVWVSRPKPSELRIHDFLTTAGIQNLGEYLRWVDRYIQYRPDVKEEWDAPPETLVRKYADCEDYAFLSQAVLKVMGYEGEVVALDFGPYQHAVTFYQQKNGTYAWIDGPYFYNTHARTPQALAPYLFKHYAESYRILSVDRETKDVHVLFDLA